ncbi:hypothetical protein EAG_11960 [Camponotus floridanus]|uniref:Uncharacterized protein n=1 Tax=Camponotus floridanus TaxID=104421 RepID=E2AW83_CAMFO|nr:hypothetical protein EAG_11960 [Camponotus floridanus]
MSFDNGECVHVRITVARSSTTAGGRVPCHTVSCRAVPCHVATWRHLPTARARPTSSHRELTLPPRRRRRRRRATPMRDGTSQPLSSPSTMNRGESFSLLPE